jgi:hypothetical protein
MREGERSVKLLHRSSSDSRSKNLFASTSRDTSSLSTYHEEDFITRRIFLFPQRNSVQKAWLEKLQNF